MAAAIAVAAQMSAHDPVAAAPWVGRYCRRLLDISYLYECLDYVFSIHVDQKYRELWRTEFPYPLETGSAARSYSSLNISIG